MIFSRPSRMKGSLGIIAASAALAVAHGAAACTIFVLTDAKRALFCNNEDWSNPKTRIWFVPAGDGHLGCAYVGFDDGGEQGGLNTAGLAFDTVAGYSEEWEADPNLATARGNPMARMLETCATVEEAVAYFRKHRFPWFSGIKILVADKSGKSVVLGARRGEMQVEEASRCRGFGFGQRALDKMLVTPPEPTVPNARAILKACLQEGETGTKYSNIFDLKSGEIYLYQPADQPEGVRLDLSAELERGPHYYDIPQIRAQLAQAPMPFLNNMKRLFIDRFSPIPDVEPDVTGRIRAVIQDTLDGRARAEDYTPDFWDGIKPDGYPAIAEKRSPDAKIEALTLVERLKDGDKGSHRYLVEFKDVVLLIHFVLDQNKVARIEYEGAQSK